MPSPAWVAPPNPAPGNVIPASHTDDMATGLLYLKDRIDNPPRAVIYHNTTQSIGTGSDVALTFNSEYGDSASLHDPSGLPTRITIPTGETGYWLFAASCEFDANATGQRTISLEIGGSFVIARNTWDAAASGGTRLAVAMLWVMNAAEYVRVVVRQNSGGALNVLSAAYFSAQRVA